MYLQALQCGGKQLRGTAEDIDEEIHLLVRGQPVMVGGHLMRL